MKEVIRLAAGHKGFIFRWDGDSPRPAMSYHTHPELELNIVISGTAKYLLPGRQYTLGAGSLVWLFPKHPHLICECSRNYSMYVIVFSQSLVEKQAKNLRYQQLIEKNPDGYFCRFVAEDFFHMFTAICESLCLGNPIPESKDAAMTWAGEAFGNQGNELYHHTNKERLNAGLEYLLMLAWDIYSKAHDQNFNTIHPAVEKAVIALNNIEDSSKFLTSGLEEIARYCGLSATRLSRLFHSQIGTPLINYRNQKRIAHFESIYRSSTKLTLAEAAYASGFGSYSQFQKTFIKVFGYSPAVYKQKLSEINPDE